MDGTPLFPDVKIDDSLWCELPIGRWSLGLLPFTSLLPFQMKHAYILGRYANVNAIHMLRPNFLALPQHYSDIRMN